MAYIITLLGLAVNCYIWYQFGYKRGREDEAINQAYERFVDKLKEAKLKGDNGEI